MCTVKLIHLKLNSRSTVTEIPNKVFIFMINSVLSKDYSWSKKVLFFPPSSLKPLCQRQQLTSESASKVHKNQTESLVVLTTYFENTVKLATFVHKCTINVSGTLSLKILKNLNAIILRCLSKLHF